MPATSIAIRQFEAACRAQGLPVTVQRRRIFEALLGRTDHPTPDQVYAAVKETLPGVSRTTVYRVLKTLVGLGVLAKACSPSAATRVDPRTHRHHHLVCQRCDRLVDVEDAAVEHRIRPPDVRRRGVRHSHVLYPFHRPVRRLPASRQGIPSVWAPGGPTGPEGEDPETHAAAVLKRANRRDTPEYRTTRKENDREGRRRS